MDKSPSIRTLVHHQPLFNQLDDLQLDRLLLGVRRLRLEKGVNLFERGDSCDGIYVVIFGRVKLFVTQFNGNEKIIEILGAGQSFGEAVMFLGKPFPLSAQLLEDSMLLHVNASVVIQALQSDTQFARRLLAGMSMRLHALVSDVSRYSETPLQRVAGYLLEQVKTIDTHTVHITLAVNKNLIASRLSIAPETFSRVLNQLHELGFITVKGKNITLNNPKNILDYINNK